MKTREFFNDSDSDKTALDVRATAFLNARPDDTHTIESIQSYSINMRYHMLEVKYFTHIVTVTK